MINKGRLENLSDKPESKYISPQIKKVEASIFFLPYLSEREPIMGVPINEPI